MPDSRFPRVVGFEVPDLRRVADPVNPEPIVGLLDIAPSEDWVSVFDVEALLFTGQMHRARLAVEGDRLLFSGSVANGPRLCADIRRLVDQVSRRRHVERTVDEVRSEGLGETSFRRND